VGDINRNQMQFKGQGWLSRINSVSDLIVWNAHYLSGSGKGFPETDVEQTERPVAAHLNPVLLTQVVALAVKPADRDHLGFSCHY